MDDLIQLLQHKRSPKRRSAARRLRKLGDVEAGPALLNALENEIKDKRTWETQYQMIMALGECGYEPALPLLSELRNEVIEATMVYVAIGDSLVRLSKPEQNDVSAVLEILEGENRMLSNGALRAMAMLKLIASDSDANAILQYARACEVNDGTHFWVVAAAPGWSGPQLESYLNYCEKSERQDIIDALLLARKKKYKKWNPF